MLNILIALAKAAGDIGSVTYAMYSGNVISVEGVTEEGEDFALTYSQQVNKNGSTDT